MIWNGGSIVSVNYRIGRFQRPSSFRARQSTIRGKVKEAVQEVEEEEERRRGRRSRRRRSTLTDTEEIFSLGVFQRVAEGLQGEVRKNEGGGTQIGGF